MSKTVTKMVLLTVEGPFGKNFEENSLRRLKEQAMAVKSGIMMALDLGLEDITYFIDGKINIERQETIFEGTIETAACWVEITWKTE